MEQKLENNGNIKTDLVKKSIDIKLVRTGGEHLDIETFRNVLTSYHIGCYKCVKR